MKKFFAGLIMGALITAAVSVFAVETAQTINVVFNRIQIVVDGDHVPRESILYNGVTYVPLRAAAELLGMDVDFFEDANTAVLSWPLGHPAHGFRRDANHPHPNGPSPGAHSSDRANAPARVPPMGIPTPQPQATAAELEAFDKLIALYDRYPHGMPWTNDKVEIRVHGNTTYVLSGCAALAVLVLEEVFGPGQSQEHHDLDSIKIGDVLRINHDSHSVIVLGVHGTEITILEGNYNSSVWWGRTLSLDSLKEQGGVTVQTRH